VGKGNFSPASRSQGPDKILGAPKRGGGGRGGWLGRRVSSYQLSIILETAISFRKFRCSAPISVRFPFCFPRDGEDPPPCSKGEKARLVVRRKRGDWSVRAIDYFHARRSTKGRSSLCSDPPFPNASGSLASTKTPAYDSPGVRRKTARTGVALETK